MPTANVSNADRLFWGDAYMPRANNSRRGVPMSPIVQVDLGSPIAAAAAGVCASQSVNAGVAALLNGSLLVGGVMVMDAPRGLVGAWTNTAVCTVTGTDLYGNVVVESSAPGTSFTGKKALKTVTSVTFSANVTGATVGTSDVLGLPYRCGGKFDILNAYADTTADIISATVVPGDGNVATATTGDVRGTYDPNTACNGSFRFRLWMKVFGVANQTEAFGVRQFAG